MIWKRFQILAQLVADTPKSFKPLPFCCQGRIFEAVVNAVCVARVNRTRLFGVVANSEDEVECLVPKFVNAFRAMAGNVDADLAHHSDGFGPYEVGVVPALSTVESLASVVPEKPSAI